MDDRRFDEMARALGTGASRRRVIGGVVAGALGLLRGGRARAQGEDASACAAVLCLYGTKCCEVCGQGTCVAIGRPCPVGDCGGESCGDAVCGAGEFCCNESCSICAPVGGVCTQQFCGDEPEAPVEPGEPCNEVTCGGGEFCCNESCSTCVPIGGFCTQEFCGEDDGPGGDDDPGADADFDNGQDVVTVGEVDVRTAPTVVAEIVAVLPAGATVTVLVGPFSFGGATWYLISLPASAAEGGPSVGFVDGAWLAPA